MHGFSFKEMDLKNLPSAMGSHVRPGLNELISAHSPPVAPFTNMI